MVNISSCCLDQHTISLGSTSKRKATEEGIVDTPQPVVKKYCFSFVEEGITPANAISLEADLHLKYYQFWYQIVKNKGGYEKFQINRLCVSQGSIIPPCGFSV